MLISTVSMPDNDKSEYVVIIVMFGCLCTCAVGFAA